MKLTHWTDKKKFILKDIPFNETRIGLTKPPGLWLSVNNSWENWIKHNWKDWMKNRKCLEVTLKKDINLFNVQDKKTLLKEFKKLTKYDYPKFPLITKEEENLKKRIINDTRSKKFYIDE